MTSMVLCAVRLFVCLFAPCIVRRAWSLFPKYVYIQLYTAVLYTSLKIYTDKKEIY